MCGVYGLCGSGMAVSIRMMPLVLTLPAFAAGRRGRSFQRGLRHQARTRSLPRRRQATSVATSAGAVSAARQAAPARPRLAWTAGRGMGAARANRLMPLATARLQRAPGTDTGVPRRAYRTGPGYRG